MENTHAANPQKIRQHSFYGRIHTASIVDDNDLQRSTVIVNASSGISSIFMCSTLRFLPTIMTRIEHRRQAHSCIALGRVGRHESGSRQSRRIWDSGPVHPISTQAVPTTHPGPLAVSVSCLGFGQRIKSKSSIDIYRACLLSSTCHMLISLSG